MTNDDELMVCIEAQKAGKAVECRSITACDQTWKPKLHRHWNTESWLYRVGPEPRRWWVNDYGTGASIFRTKDHAMKMLACDGECVEVVEVLHD